MARRLHKTLLDYMVIGISPALIMVLIGSLCFFLLEVFYAGPHIVRLRFIVGLFVLGTVSVSRLSIEEGREYAALFGLPLALVCTIAMFSQVGRTLPVASPLINIALLALAWWCADKLTWDCTVIDEGQDASGQGLLQRIGWERSGEESAQAEPPAPPEAEGTSSTESSGIKWWDRFVEKRHRPHTPGVWIIYVSLIALPLFGLLQRMIPTEDTPSRRWAFSMLFLYVASALGLLLTTSFLGLRRYLRQRQIEMPGDMAGMWLGIGGVLIVVLLLFCALLPRPSAEYALSQSPLRMPSTDNLRPSRWGFGSDGPQTDEAQQTTTSQQPNSQQSKAPADANSQSNSVDPQNSGGDQSSSSGDQSSSSGSSSSSSKASDRQPPPTEPSAANDQAASDDRSTSEEPSSDNGQTPPENQSSSRPSDAADGRQNKQTKSQQDQSKSREDASRDQRSSQQSERTSSTEQPQQQAENQPQETTSQQASRSRDRSSAPPLEPARMLSSLSGMLLVLFKFLLYGALIAVAAYLAWKYREQIRASWHKFLAELRDLWQRLFGGSQAQEPRQESPAEVVVQHRPFSAYADPFLTGAADRQTPEQLVRYTFEAFEAWAREQGYERRREQTPLEFAQRVGKRERALRHEAERLATLYSRLAYAQRKIPAASAQELRSLWAMLRPVPAS